MITSIRHASILFATLGPTSTLLSHVGPTSLWVATSAPALQTPTSSIAVPVMRSPAHHSDAWHSHVQSGRPVAVTASTLRATRSTLTHAAPTNNRTPWAALAALLMVPAAVAMWWLRTRTAPACSPLQEIHMASVEARQDVEARVGPTPKHSVVVVTGCRTNPYPRVRHHSRHI